MEVPERIIRRLSLRIGDRVSYAISRNGEACDIKIYASFEKRMGAPQILARSCSLTEW